MLTGTQIGPWSWKVEEQVHKAIVALITPARQARAARPKTFAS
jgi:hypothetical protein